jgi:hypothetical protein
MPDKVHLCAVSVADDRIAVKAGDWEDGAAFHQCLCFRQPLR